MPMDTHAAFRELENGGFDAKQAEALVSVLNGTTGDQASTADLKELGEGVNGLRGDVKELREGSNRLQGDVKELRDDFSRLQGDVKELRDDFKDLQGNVNRLQGDVKDLREGFNRFQDDFKELKDDLKDQFATKADLRAEVAVGINKVLFGVLAIAGLLFAALQLWPPS